MSYDPRLGAQPYGAPGADDEPGSKKGSVRAARQRLQAAQMRTQLPDTSKIIGLPPRPKMLASQDSAQGTFGQPQQSRSPEGRGNAPLNSPPPQWPLSNTNNDVLFSPITPAQSQERLQVVQPPIRPVSDDYPIQQPSPDYPPPSFPNYPSTASPEPGMAFAGEEMLSPYSYRDSRPLTTSSGVSGVSELSSLGSIPDFPVPLPPISFQQVRRTPSLGPPPSARRGPSSYYTQMSYVSPIVEEAETRSNTIRSRHGSFASSNVFPLNDDFYPQPEIISDDDDTVTSDRGAQTPTEVDDYRRLVKDQPSLARQASLGKRTKPSLTTIKFGDNPSSQSNVGKVVAGTAAAGAIGASGAMLARTDSFPLSSRRSPLSNGTGLLDPSSPSSDSVDSIGNLRSRLTDYTRSMSPVSAFQNESFRMSSTDRMGRRRPPRLDVDAVREAESRGSLTSLPDLIRRATRLAANLDRGKTASRIGMDFWESGGPDRQYGRQSGMSDMLAAFPPPRQDTPQRTGTGTPNTANGMSNWPLDSLDSRSGETDSGLRKERPKKGRRCCGLPFWAFIVLLIFLLIIIATAVVVPVVIIVLPNQRKSSQAPAQGNNNGATGTTPVVPAPTASPGSDKCEDVLNCQNGGVAILNMDRTCSCICVNGFTGRTCTSNEAAGCTTTSVRGVSDRVTIGSGMPRLIQSATTTFNVPLNATRLLSIFSSLSLSCAAENALITFNGLAARSLSQYLHSINLRNLLTPTRSYPLLDHPHPAPWNNKLEHRQNGDSTAAPSPEKTAQPISSNVVALDFARIGVLLALQLSGSLDSAASAQEAIQNFLTSNRNGNAASDVVDVKLFKMDLVNFTIQFKNGTTTRANPSSPSSSS